MSKHTPGPWAIKQSDGGWWINEQSSGHGFTLGSLIPVDEVEANARLIAAAPEMLEALKTILNEDTGEGYDAYISQLIAKAEGN